MPSEFCLRRIARFWRLRQNGNLPITDVVVLPDNVKQWQPDYNGKSLVTSRHYVLPKGRLCHRLILVRCPMNSIIPHCKIYFVVERRWVQSLVMNSMRLVKAQLLRPSG